MKWSRTWVVACAVLAALTIASSGAAAEETLKLAIGQRGYWDTSVPELGQRAGIFAKRGLKLELLYTQGGGETQQAVISGSVDIGIAAGASGVIGAYVKGAPVRVIAAETTGAADYWYVPASSSIKSIKDTDDKTVAYSTNGSSTNAIVLAFMKQYGVKAKPTATGGPSGTFTQVMSGQVDVGWAAPPFGLEALEQGKIRIIGSGNDIPTVKDQTVRFVIVNAQVLEKRKDAIAQFAQAYRETIDWMYTNPAAMTVYAEFAKISEAHAMQVRDKFFPRWMLDPDKIIGLDTTLAEALNGKFIPAPMTKEQIAGLIQLQAPVK
jgi:NitT/TauT family transport system substrate-binding protein